MKFSMQSINNECQTSKSLQKWRDREVKLQKKKKTTIVIKIWLLRESLRIFQETIKIVVGFEDLLRCFWGKEEIIQSREKGI